MKRYRNVKLDTDDRLLAEDDEISMSEDDEIASVSYTHLTVYMYGYPEPWCMAGI